MSDESTVEVLTPYAVVRRYSEFGKTRIWIECPFCGKEVEAYMWSLAGTGKKCPKCGALHTQFGSRRKKVKDGKPAQ